MNIILLIQFLKLFLIKVKNTLFNTSVTSIFYFFEWDINIDLLLS